MCSWELSSLCCERALRELGRRLQTNRAFVFIKPHAVNDKVKALVKEHFQKHNITIIAEATISSEVPRWASVGWDASGADRGATSCAGNRCQEADRQPLLRHRVEGDDPQAT
jgi:hypothetical protein